MGTVKFLQVLIQVLQRYGMRATTSRLGIHIQEYALYEATGLSAAGALGASTRIGKGVVAMAQADKSIVQGVIATLKQKGHLVLEDLALVRPDGAIKAIMVNMKHPKGQYGGAVDVVIHEVGPTKQLLLELSEEVPNEVASDIVTEFAHVVGAQGVKGVITICEALAEYHLRQAGGFLF